MESQVGPIDAANDAGCVCLDGPIDGNNLSTNVKLNPTDGAAESCCSKYYTEEFLGYLAEIFAIENNISIKNLSILTLVSTYIHLKTQWRLNSLKKIYFNSIERFSTALKRWRIGHPIQYTSTSTKILPISSIIFTYFGMHPIYEISIKDKAFALANICLIARQPVPTTLTFMLREDIIYIKKIKPSEYEFIGSDTPTNQEPASEDDLDVAGDYFVDLHLPFKINPIMFGGDTYGLKKEIFTICPQPTADNQPPGLVVCDPLFMGSYFSHMILQFKTVDIADYNWNDYFPVCNDDEISWEEYSRTRPYLLSRRQIDSRQSEFMD